MEEDGLFISPKFIHFGKFDFYRVYARKKATRAIPISHVGYYIMT